MKTLAFYVRLVHENWKYQIKLRTDGERLYLIKREFYYKKQKVTKIDEGEVNPHNVTKAFGDLKNML